MNNMKEVTILNFEGEKGKSLFYRLLQSPETERAIENTTKKFLRFIKKSEELKDDRALVIMGAIFVENELDNFLALWIKKYKKVKTENSFTFSLKVELALSLNLIPARILESIEPIRKIRNIFAHEFNIDTFKKAKEDTKGKENISKMREKLKAFKGRESVDSESVIGEDDNLPKLSSDDSDDNRAIFKELIILITGGLNLYAGNLNKVQNYIWDTKNLNKIVSPGRESNP